MKCAKVNSYISSGFLKSAKRKKNGQNSPEKRCWFSFIKNGTVWITVISPYFLVNYLKLWRNCAFPQNAHTRKLGKITVWASGKLTLLGSFCYQVMWEWGNVDNQCHLANLGAQEILTCLEIFKNCSKTAIYEGFSLVLS